MKKIHLILLQVQMLADGGAVFITRPSKENPSENGVHKISAGQFQRIVTRALGIFNPIGFKALIAVCNGSAKLSIDMQSCVEGEAWENKVTGEKGTYTKNWTKYSNHEVELGIVGQMKVAELSLSSSFALAAQGYSQPVSVARKEAVEAGGTTDEKPEGEGKTTEDTNV